MRLRLTKFTIEEAAANWGINPRTLSKRLKREDIEPKDGKLTVKQINAVVFGDMEGERLRRERAEADLAERKVAQMDGELLPVLAIQRAWEFIIVNLRQKIWHSDKIPEDVKRECLNDLQQIPINDYRTTTEGDSDADAANTQPTGAAA